MYHAMLAAGIVATTVLMPRRIVQQLLKRRMMRVGDQVAGAFPALDVASRVAPSGAFELALAGQELEVDWRRSQLVLPEQPLHLLELGPDVIPCHEDLGGARGIGFVDGGVTVSRREHEAVNAKPRQVRK